MENGQEAYFGSQTFGIGGHFQKSLGYRSEQASIDDCRVLQGERRQLVRQVKTTWE